MNGLRLVFVMRRYWPLVGGAEMVMANLASELRERGATVTIVTAQWHADWPQEVVHREVPVVRLPNPLQRGWGTLRYMLAFSGWLRKHRDEFDLVYVSMLKHDAHAAVGALARSQIPVVLRAEGGGPAGDCQWQHTARLDRGSNAAVKPPMRSSRRACRSNRSYVTPAIHRNACIKSRTAWRFRRRANWRRACPRGGAGRCQCGFTHRTDRSGCRVHRSFASGERARRLAACLAGGRRAISGGAVVVGGGRAASRRTVRNGAGFGNSRQRGIAWQFRRRA